MWLWPQKAPGMCAQEFPVVFTYFLLFIKMHILKIFHRQRDPLTDWFTLFKNSFNKSNNFCLQILLEIQLNAHFDIFRKQIYKQTDQSTSITFKNTVGLQLISATTFAFRSSLKFHLNACFEFFFPQTDRPTDQPTYTKR